MIEQLCRDGSPLNIAKIVSILALIQEIRGYLTKSPGIGIWWQCDVPEAQRAASSSEECS